jgi:serine/threonine protein kinase
MRWRREMLVIRKLSHPNIPHYIDGFFMPEKGSLYMQPCRLGSVSKWLDTHNADYLSPEMQEFMLWHILHQVAEAVLYMQTGFQNLADLNRSTRDKAQGWVVLVHGDIRIDQIFLDNPSNGPTVSALLGDFGFAQFIKPWHRTEMHDGPGAESSSKGPEFPYKISEATDVFGLGATAQQYVNRYEKPTAGLHPGYLTRFKISTELDHLICSCTAIRPSRRPNIRELVEKLEWGIAQ